jgi:hypothetical protein
VAPPESGEGSSCLIVLPEDKVELETIATTQLPHYLIDDELRVSVYVKPLNPKFGGDAHTIH